jgi:hypothetical protein
MSETEDFASPYDSNDLANNNSTDPGGWVLVNVPSAGRDTVPKTVNGVMANWMEVVVNDAEKVMVQCDINTKVPPEVASILQQGGWSTI